MDDVPSGLKVQIRRVLAGNPDPVAAQNSLLASCNEGKLLGFMPFGGI
jgi:hypothetical protein